MPASLSRWRRRTLTGFAQVEGFVAVLMKRRNGEAWTAADRAFLREGLQAAAHWAPLVVLFLLPGGFLLLPGYAWLLDRRRAGRRTKPPSPSAT